MSPASGAAGGGCAEHSPLMGGGPLHIVSSTAVSSVTGGRAVAGGRSGP